MGYTPPFIATPKGILINDINLICEKLLLSRLEIDFLKGIFDLAGTLNRYLSVTEVLDEKIKTIIGARRRLDSLVKKGALIKAIEKIDGRSRGVAIYSFRKLMVTDLAELTNIEQVETRVIEVSRLEGARGLEIETDSSHMTIDPAIDDLICQTFFAALDYNRRGKSQYMETLVDWFGYRVLVKTRTVTSSILEEKVIARVTDLRYYIAVLTLADSILMQSRARCVIPENMFFLDVGDIVCRMGRECNGGNIKTAIKTLTRLNDTQFCIDDVPGKFIKRYGFGSGSIKLNPLHDLSFFEEKKGLSGKYKKTFVSFSLPSLVFKRILKNEAPFILFRINPDVLLENNTILFAFHLFCRRRLGRATGKELGADIRQSFEYLRDAIAPNMPLLKFREKFSSSLHQFAQKQGCANSIVYHDKNKKLIAKASGINIYGYILFIDMDRIRIRVDYDDQYSGLNMKNHLTFVGKNGSSEELEEPENLNSFKQHYNDLLEPD